MKTKILFASIALLFISNIYAQSNLNEYKYVIVPKKFDFLKEADKYQLNSLTKFLFEKEGFTALFEGSNLPEDLMKNRCLALYSNVLDNSGMLRTKLIVELKDCNNQVVFKTQEGTSREKNHKASHHEALRNAFKSFKAVNYKFTPREEEQEIKEVKIKEPKVIVAPVIKETPKVEKPKVQEAPEKVEPVKESVKVEEGIVEKPEIKEIPKTNFLYAQEISKGYQLVDSTPKIVMILLRTPKQDVYIVKGKDAVVYKENGVWYFAKDSKSEALKIKF